jgi:hypothetical protein
MEEKPNKFPTYLESFFSNKKINFSALDGFIELESDYERTEMDDIDVIENNEKPWNIDRLFSPNPRSNENDQLNISNLFKKGGLRTRRKSFQKEDSQGESCDNCKNIQAENFKFQISSISLSQIITILEVLTSNNDPCPLEKIIFNICKEMEIPPNSSIKGTQIPNYKKQHILRAILLDYSHILSQIDTFAVFSDALFQVVKISFTFLLNILSLWKKNDSDPMQMTPNFTCIKQSDCNLGVANSLNYEEKMKEEGFATLDNMINLSHPNFPSLPEIKSDDPLKFNKMPPIVTPNLSPMEGFNNNFSEFASSKLPIQQSKFTILNTISDKPMNSENKLNERHNSDKEELKLVMQKAKNEIRWNNGSELQEKDYGFRGQESINVKNRTAKGSKTSETLNPGIVGQDQNGSELGKIGNTDKGTFVNYGYENMENSFVNYNDMSISDLSLFSTTSKRPHKQWTTPEINFISTVLSNNDISKFTDPDWIQLANHLQRSISSIHAKCKNVLKKKKINTCKNNQTSASWHLHKNQLFPSIPTPLPPTSLIPLSASPSNFYSNQSKLVNSTSPSKEHKSNLKQTKSNTNFDMISQALKQFPSFQATKEQILEKIGLLFRLDDSQILKMEKSVLQCLSKRFQPLKGTFKLNDDVKSIDGIMFEQCKKKSNKIRIIYILSQLPNREGTLSTIKQNYLHLFQDNLDFTMSAESNLAVWEKTLSKTLLSQNEFDKSNSKTKYTFRSSS